MKKIFIFIGVMLFVSGCFAENPDRQPVVSVTGKSEIKTAPDMVGINLVAQADSMDLKKAKEKNDRLAAALIKTLKKYGVDEKNIQTGRISIEPRYSKRYEKKDFRGYFVTKNITALLKDIEKFEGLLTALVDKGADRVTGIDFRTSKEDELRKKARLRAVSAAKKKASEMAREIGQSTGKAIIIRESRAMPVRAANERVFSAASASKGGGTFEPGQIIISAEVYCEFELK